MAELPVDQMGGCGLALALPLLAGGLALRGFREIATPLADVMAAADSVADADAETGCRRLNT